MLILYSIYRVSEIFIFLESEKDFKSAIIVVDFNANISERIKRLGILFSNIVSSGGVVVKALYPKVREAFNISSFLGSFFISLVIF